MCWPTWSMCRALISYLPTMMGVLGIGLAYVMYVAVPTLPARFGGAFPAGTGSC